MSIYYSKFDLNTYRSTSYFTAHIPVAYPIAQTLIKSRAFRRLPPNLQQLASLAKQWVNLHWPSLVELISRWYDDEGYELNPDTGKRLTDKEIDKLWMNTPTGKVIDIPIPPSGFADPATWIIPLEPEEPDDEADFGRTEAELLHDIDARSREYVAREYGVEVADSDAVQAQTILAKFGRGGVASGAGAGAEASGSLFAGAPPSP